MMLHLAGFARQLLDEVIANGRILIAQLSDLPLAICDQHDIAYRFGSEAMLRKVCDREQITGEKKTRNLPPAVGPVPAQPNAAAHQPVGILGRIALIEDRFAPPDAQSGS